MKFKVVIREGEDGWYVVECPSLPGCISQGKTVAEALENIKEAIELSEDVKWMWKKSFFGTDAFVPGESPHLTYRIHRATDDLLKEIAATENPFKLRVFSPPEPITSRGITFNEFCCGEHLFKLKAPIKVEAEPSSEGWILYHEDLSILAVAPTMEECIDEFKEYFYVLWEEYVNKKDDELTDSGQALKHKLLDIVE